MERSICGSSLVVCSPDGTIQCLKKKCTFPNSFFRNLIQIAKRINSLKTYARFIRQQDTVSVFKKKKKKIKELFIFFFFC